jgi:DNA-binding response OmpR family regulator
MTDHAQETDRLSLRERSAALRAASDALIAESAALHDRSLALRQRMGRLDWPDVRVLNVEDHEPTRVLRTRTLEQAGYSVLEADTGEEAIAVALSNPSIRLALLDLELPDASGFKVCRHLKACQSEMQVVMITSIYRSGAARQNGIGVGADEYLLEPLPGHRLVRTVERLLTTSRATGEPAVITTDAFGLIVDLNAPACDLLHLSARAAVGRSLLTFVAADRARVAACLQIAAAGQFVQEDLVLRPRERKPLTLEVDLDGGDAADRTVSWTLRRVPEAPRMGQPLAKAG